MGQLNMSQFIKTSTSVLLVPIVSRGLCLALNMSAVDACKFSIQAGICSSHANVKWTSHDDRMLESCDSTHTWTVEEECD